MSFASAVAGPSRLPLGALRQSAKRAPVIGARRHASSDAADGDASEASAADADPETRAAEAGYQTWLNGSGRQYQTVRKGQQAIWLGGSVPYPANPSFRPPPPLSNDLQNVLYDKLRAGATAAQLSHRYNVSKARIEAIRKLKDVEREFQRQQIPTQDAFQTGMESLLNVRSPLNPRSKAVDNVRERDEATSRALHPSSSVERTEEDRWEAGIGRGGAFGDRMSQATREGIERTAWEFRDEETEMRERKAAAQDGSSAKQAVQDAANEVATAQAGSDTPEAHRIADALAHPPKSSVKPSEAFSQNVAQAGKYIFVDVSGQARWKQAKKTKAGGKL